MQATLITWNLKIFEWLSLSLIILNWNSMSQHKAVYLFAFCRALNVWRWTSKNAINCYHGFPCCRIIWTFQVHQVHPSRFMSDKATQIIHEDVVASRQAQRVFFGKFCFPKKNQLNQLKNLQPSSWWNIENPWNRIRTGQKRMPGWTWQKYIKHVWNSHLLVDCQIC